VVIVLDAFFKITVLEKYFTSQTSIRRPENVAIEFKARPNNPGFASRLPSGLCQCPLTPLGLHPS